MATYFYPRGDEYSEPQDKTGEAGHRADPARVLLAQARSREGRPSTVSDETTCRWADMWGARRPYLRHQGRGTPASRPALDRGTPLGRAIGAAERSLRRAKAIELDLREVTFMDSAGVQVLAYMRTGREATGRDSQPSRRAHRPSRCAGLSEPRITVPHLARRRRPRSERSVIHGGASTAIESGPWLRSIDATVPTVRLTVTLIQRSRREASGATAKPFPPCWPVRLSCASGQGSATR